MAIRISALVVGAGLVMGLLGGAMQAQAVSMAKQCGEEWAAAKKAGTVPTGTTWPKFLGECKTRHAGDTAAAPAAAPAKVTPAVAVAPAPPPAPAPAPVVPAAAPAPASAPAPATTTAKAPSAGREAMVTRERQCGARWKQIKGTTGLPSGITTWPKYWSWCNTQLKAGKTI